MTLRRYLFLFLFPYALLAGCVALGFAWTNAQEQRLAAHDALVTSAVDDARQQCDFDDVVRREDAPAFCERLR